jgi:hypothetical protein
MRRIVKMDKNQTREPVNGHENEGISLFGSLASQMEKLFEKNEIFQFGKKSGTKVSSLIDEAVDFIFKK